MLAVSTNLEVVTGGRRQVLITHIEACPLWIDNGNQTAIPIEAGIARQNQNLTPPSLPSDPESASARIILPVHRRHALLQFDIITKFIVDTDKWLADLII